MGQLSLFMFSQPANNLSLLSQACMVIINVLRHYSRSVLQLFLNYLFSYNTIYTMSSFSEAIGRMAAQIIFNKPTESCRVNHRP